MDVGLELFGGIAGILLVAIVGSWYAAGGANALAGLVASWREPGWPRGVQEDDEVRWAWRAPERSPAESGSAPAVEPVDTHLAWRGR